MHIHVASAVNREYLAPMAVLIDSLKSHLTPATKLSVHLLHAGLSQSDLAPIASLVELNPILISDLHSAGIPSDARFPPEAAFPLLLADVLPANLERVLFLDADMLVLDDVSIIWETNLENHVLAAVQDSAIPLCSSARAVKNWQGCGMSCRTEYFNGGLLLVNLPRWRSGNVTARVFEYLRRNRGHVDFYHQEGLNAVLWNERVLLDQRWNLTSSLTGVRRGGSGVLSVSRPGIVHFSGSMKPWRFQIAGSFHDAYQPWLARAAKHYHIPAPSIRERLLSFYDRYVRDTVYPVEQFLWRHRWQ